MPITIALRNYLYKCSWKFVSLRCTVDRLDKSFASSEYSTSPEYVNLVNWYTFRRKNIFFNFTTIRYKILKHLTKENRNILELP